MKAFKEGVLLAVPDVPAEHRRTTSLGNIMAWVNSLRCFKMKAFKEGVLLAVPDFPAEHRRTTVF